MHTQSEIHFSQIKYLSCNGQILKYLIKVACEIIIPKYPNREGVFLVILAPSGGSNPEGP